MGVGPTLSTGKENEVLECPYCKGLLRLEATGQGTWGPVQSKPKFGVEALVQWVNEPVPLSDLLIDYGCSGDLSRFEPLSRMVVRTAFRTVDAVRALELGVPSEQFRFIVARMPGWSSETTKARFVGVQGRWWVKVGYEWAPGFVEAADDLV